MPGHLRSVALCAFFLSACHQSPDPDIASQPETRSVRVASSGPTYGDCANALQRAAAKPDLDVDRLPVPRVRQPAPLSRVPLTALRDDGSADVQVDVIIDTLGKADMTTFTVVSASSPWLARSVRRAIGRWTFSPAELAGCKARASITSRPRRHRGLRRSERCNAGANAVVLASRTVSLSPNPRAHSGCRRLQRSRRIAA